MHYLPLPVTLPVATLNYYCSSTLPYSTTVYVVAGTSGSTSSCQLECHGGTASHGGMNLKSDSDDSELEESGILVY